MAKNVSHTLLEVIAVIIIVSILATLALNRYTYYREVTFFKEAKANLKLIMAAERIYRMDLGGYYDSGAIQPDAISNINDNLRLFLSAAANRVWNYMTVTNNSAVPPTTCAQATRKGYLPAWTVRMRNTEDQPVIYGVCP